MNNKDLSIYAITDRAWLGDDTLAQAVEKAIIGGATIVQLREKLLKGEELKQLALEVKAICNRYCVPFIINDDVYLAKEIDADGVHVGQSDMAIKQARELLGPDKIVGATAKTIEQATKAEAEGADYLGSGAIFGTTTKKDALPMTMELLNSICDSVSIPVVAIGGIDETNVSKLRGAKIAGVAVVSGIFAQKNITAATENLSEILYGKKIVQCITNPVTMNQVANVVLAAKGSPIMAHHICEVAEVQSFADGLLVNLGATDDYDAIRIAYQTALDLGHPIVIDPVGVGGISFRRDFLKSLLEFGSPACIRGNYGEIKAIYQQQNTMRGLDFDEGSDEKLVEALARQLGCIVVASGETDIITDGSRTIMLQCGSPMQKQITGAGCMLSAVICTKLCNGPAISVDSVAYCCGIMGTSAEEAAALAEGPMSFQNKWMDRISMEL